MPDNLDPRSREELFLNGILSDDPSDLPDPETREELYLKAIAEKIGSRGLPDTTDASIGDALILDNDKNPVWSTPSGGTKKYMHYISVRGGVYDSGISDPFGVSFSAITDSATPITTLTLTDLLTSLGATTYAIGYPCSTDLMPHSSEINDAFSGSRIRISLITGCVSLIGGSIRFDLANSSFSFLGGTYNELFVSYVTDYVVEI